MKSIGQILADMLPSFTETYIDKLLASTTIGINDMIDTERLALRVDHLEDDKTTFEEYFQQVFERLDKIEQAIIAMKGDQK